ncbi:MAG: hypothetical protein Fur0022_42500 [Anaerolineales bacterium]
MPFTTTDAEQTARVHFSLPAAATPLPGELDANFLLTTPDGAHFILKIAHPSRTLELLDLENCIMAHLEGTQVALRTPRVLPAPTGERITPLARGAFVRLLTYLPGEVLARVPHTPRLLQNFGTFLGELDRALQNFTHPAMKRELMWDLTRAGEVIRKYSGHLTASHPSTALDIGNFERQASSRSAQDAADLAEPQHPERRDGGRLVSESKWSSSAPVPQSKGAAHHRSLLLHFLHRFERCAAPHLPYLPWQVIHNDANDYNVLIENDQISGLLDFGDALYNPRICELAIGIAYAILNKSDPLTTAVVITKGYHAVNPLTEDEIAVLWDLIGARLAVSVTMSTYRAFTEPENEYHQISAAPAWNTLAQLAEIAPDFAHFTLRRACGLPPFPQTVLRTWFRAHPEDFAALAQTLAPTQTLSIPEIEKIRHEQIGFNLSLSYKKPLHIVRGWKQYLYDPDGREYLDCVNNVCHVGHSHPRVVAALASQAAILNTNTRYYHPNIARLAERLTAKMPGNLRVCFFVNSGSEANDLALRLARAYTGRKDMLVLEGAYHGNLISTVEISPYKFDGPGGAGAPEWVYPLPLPCAYRGRLRAREIGSRGVGEFFVEEAESAIRQITDYRSPNTNPPLAGFISEAIIGTGGQVVFPEGYLAAVYERVRAAGGVCIADEVQHGFGRVGTHFWGFEQHSVIPDIVTMGKPFGNGHPLAAVVTTREIAAAFHNGMEYFNTFGGSPVSCAVGLAVMEVIEEEELQAHALEVGNFWKAGLEELKERYPLIGDVRGSGLFLGIELVRDRETLEPADKEASEIVERMKERGILLSTDGPLHNVIKIKPPMVITREDVERVVEALGVALEGMKE